MYPVRAAAPCCTGILSSPPTIRTATESDARAIAEVVARAIGVGLRGFLPEERMPSAEIGWVVERLGADDVEVVVAELDGEVAGVAIYGSSRDEDAPDSAGELRVLHVVPEHWRRGVGRALVDRALAALLEMGYREATLWSAADNQRANAFYAAWGFARDGADQRRARFGNVLEVRYRIALVA